MKPGTAVYVKKMQSNRCFVKKNRLGIDHIGESMVQIKVVSLYHNGGIWHE